MLIDLLARNNYQSFNIKLARGIGLKSAVYLEALLEINERAVRKQCVSDDGTFSIDREYITLKTTLTIKEQHEIEEQLCSLGIIEVEPKGAETARVLINVSVLTGLCMQEDEVLQGDLSRIKNASNKGEGKRIGNLNSVKRHIRDSYPEDLKQAYADWLDIVSAKFGFVSIKMLEDAEAQIEAYTRNVDLAIDVLRIATAQGWKMISAAIDVSKKNQARITTSSGVREVKNVQVNRNEGF